MTDADPQSTRRSRHWIGYRDYEPGEAVMLTTETTAEQWRGVGFKVEGPFVTTNGASTVDAPFRVNT